MSLLILLLSFMHNYVALFSLTLKSTADLISQTVHTVRLPILTEANSTHGDKMIQNTCLLWSAAIHSYRCSNITESIV